MPPKITYRSPFVEAAVGFVLGAVGGSILGATEDPVHRSLYGMTAPTRMRPLVDEARTVGPLGLGSLIGATALTTAMTSVVAGVILAAAVASVFVVTRSCGASTQTNTAALWVAAGIAGVYGTTSSGATLGMTIDWIVQNYGMVGLLWALSLFTIIKTPFHFIFKTMFQAEMCCGLNAVWVKEREEIEKSDSEQRIRVAEQIEQQILTLENGGEPGSPEEREQWAKEKRKREALERKRIETEEAEIEQRSLQDWINTIVMKHIDFLAFSGIPMTFIAVISSLIGVYGYGGHQIVMPLLLGLVAIIAYALLKTNEFKFWMLIGCMGMIATIVVALLTIHAEQMVVSDAVKLHKIGVNHTKSEVETRMNYQASLEALNAGYFVAKVCQLGLGATVGGPLVRQGAGEARVIVGAAVLGGALLLGVQVLGPLLGDGGAAGAMLGAVGATGASLGAAAALAGRWSSWLGTVATLAGLVLGALTVGEWHIVNIGLQLPVAYVFAMTNPF
ncbi:hypothetical protein NL108_004137 [Boleophthalmus pectinirostris]|uniref:uncharacterized protein LOC129411780 n=1 Tax=Boleophthalmus pectinirostris TaxID=150288 RepID=UPI00242EE285|nr:uncharacterized protein LOC129411780 [Boleophthalmus pectinirostris]KAJ0066249.1 hypothetical protein NL108_004137 [Boleophthalmus pectinirostris]